MCHLHVAFWQWAKIENEVSFVSKTVMIICKVDTTIWHIDVISAPDHLINSSDFGNESFPYLLIVSQRNYLICSHTDLSSQQTQELHDKSTSLFDKSPLSLFDMSTYMYF